MSALEQFQRSVGFTKVPMNPGDSGEAFMGFVSFANGDSIKAKNLRSKFNTERSHDDRSIQQIAASFIDWLIVNHWGEAPAAAIERSV